MVERIGQQLGNYQLSELIGKGGFAEVYIGEHIYLKNQVAIKVLHAHMGEVDTETFLHEARTLVKLIHPHIIRVLDFGIEQDTPFLVMDYAPHGNLRQRYPAGVSMPLPLVIKYVQQLAAALQCAHDQKLIHRDVKPENMLLDRNNDVLLSDFGVAIIAQSSHYPAVQEQGGAAGTVAYMAPEQIQAQPRAASDQYALAIVAYEWISGERPFRGSFTEVAIKHTLVAPPSLCEQVPGLPPAVEQVIFTALAKAPEERFASIQAFARALEQAASDPEVENRIMPVLTSAQRTPVLETPELQPEIRIVPVPGRLTRTPISLASQSQPPRREKTRKRSVLIGISVLLILFLSIGAVALGARVLNVYAQHPGQGTGTTSLRITPTLTATARATPTPGRTPTTVAPSPTALVSYPLVTGSYSGQIDNTLAFINSTMTLYINQNQENITGQFTVAPPLSGTGPFTGTVTLQNAIQFIVTSASTTAPILFQGSVYANHSMSGTYCSINAQKKCDASVGGYGTWNVQKD